MPLPTVSLAYLIRHEHGFGIRRTMAEAVDIAADLSMALPEPVEVFIGNVKVAIFQNGSQVDLDFYRKPLQFAASA